MPISGYDNRYLSLAIPTFRNMRVSTKTLTKWEARLIDGREVGGRNKPGGEQSNLLLLLGTRGAGRGVRRRWRRDGGDAGVYD